MLDLAQVCVKEVEVSVEFSIELAARFASLFNDWVFHESTFHQFLRSID
jgi:hypothetical protein